MCEKFHGVCNALWSCFCYVSLVLLIMFGGAAHIPAINYVGCSCSSIIWVLHTITFVLGGVIGGLLNSTAPLNCASANSRSFDDRNKFCVVVHCWIDCTIDAMRNLDRQCIGLSEIFLFRC